MRANLLIEAIRGGIQEKYFDGWVMVVDKSARIVKSLEYSDYTCLMRSCEKPLQAMAAYDLGAVDKFKFDRHEIPLSFASHTGSKEHQKVLLNIMRKTGIREDQLLCGILTPADRPERERLIRENLQPGVLHNNCSGKHIFVIAACLAQGWDTTTYANPNHPVQHHINTIIKKYCNPQEMHIAFDGCDMPVHSMTLAEMGAGFAKLFDGNTQYAEILAEAIAEYPEMAGGNGRIDTSIMQASKGKLIAKGGAEGLIIVTPRHTGEALVVKVAAGVDPIRNMVVVEALRQLNWLDTDPCEDAFLSEFANVDIINHAKRKVGVYKFNFSI